MEKPPISINANEVIGMNVDGAFLILIRKGSENDKTVMQFMERFFPKVKSEIAPAPDSKPKNPPPISLLTEDIGILNIHDTHHLLIVKRGSETEKEIFNFIAQHGNKIPRHTQCRD